MNKQVKIKEVKTSNGWANIQTIEGQEISIKLDSNPKLQALINSNATELFGNVVEKNGNLTDIKVLRGIGGGCDEEAVRVLKNAPAWKPGIQNGRPVRVAYTMPIFFQLAGQ